MFTKESNRGLRADAADTRVEVRPDQDRGVDEFFSRQTEGSEILIEIEQFGRHGARSAAGREEFGRSDREEPNKPGRAEQERVVVLRAGCPGLPLDQEVGSLGLSFTGRLDPRDSDESQECLRLLHHRARETEVITAFDQAVAVSPAATAALYSRCDFSRTSIRFWISFRFRSGGRPSKTNTGW